MANAMLARGALGPAAARGPSSRGRELSDPNAGWATVASSRPGRPRVAAPTTPPRGRPTSTSRSAGASASTATFPSSPLGKGPLSCVRRSLRFTAGTFPHSFGRWSTTAAAASSAPCSLGAEPPRSSPRATSSASSAASSAFGIDWRTPRSLECDQEPSTFRARRVPLARRQQGERRRRPLTAGCWSCAAGHGGDVLRALDDVPRRF